MTIEIDRYRSIFVMGEVGQPGQYAYVPGMTISQRHRRFRRLYRSLQPARCRRDAQDQRPDHHRSRADHRSDPCRRHHLRARTAFLINARKRPLRIVHCFRSPVGGIFRHVRDLAEHHSRAGHQVGIVCDSSTGSEHEDKLFAQIMPHLTLGLERLPIRRSVGIEDLAALKRCYNHIKALQPDILHGHGAKGGVVARVIGSILRVQRYRVARLYSPHGGSLHFRPRTLSGETVFMAERVLERATEAISFVCDHERQTYEARSAGRVVMPCGSTTASASVTLAPFPPRPAVPTSSISACCVI